jgi:hypothetical protein
VFNVNRKAADMTGWKHDQNPAMYRNCHDAIHNEQVKNNGRRPMLVGTALDGLWFGYGDLRWQDPIALWSGRQIIRSSHAAVGPDIIDLALIGPVDAQAPSARTSDGMSMIGFRLTEMQHFSHTLRIIPVSPQAEIAFNNAYPSKR